MLGNLVSIESTCLIGLVGKDLVQIKEVSVEVGKQLYKSNGLQTWLRFVTKQYDSNLSRLKDLDEKRLEKLISAICPSDPDEQNRLKVQYSVYCASVYLDQRNEKSNDAGVYNQRFPKYCLALWCRLAESKVERLMLDALAQVMKFDDNDWLRMAVVQVTNQFKSILSLYLFQDPNDKIDQKRLCSKLFSQNTKELSAFEVALNNSDKRPKPNVPMPRQLFGSSEFLFEYPPTYDGTVKLLNKYVESILDWAKEKKTSSESKEHNDGEALNRLRLKDDCRKFQLLCQQRIEMMYPAEAAFTRKISSVLKRELRPKLLGHYADTLLSSIEEFHDELNDRHKSRKPQKTNGRATGKASPPNKPHGLKWTEKQTLIISALVRHHEYENKTCMNFDPIDQNQAAQRLEISSGTFTTFWEKAFSNNGKKGTYKVYQQFCMSGDLLNKAIEMLTDGIMPGIFRQ